MRTQKKVLAILLALCMVVSLLPTAALATTTVNCTASDCAHVAAIGETHYDTLAEAAAAVHTKIGDERMQETVITLLRDATGSGVGVGYASINNNGTTSGNSPVNITFDLNGHTYTVNDPAVGSFGTETAAFQLLQGSTVTFKNGKIDIASGATRVKRMIQNYANLTLENVTFDATNQVGGQDYALSFNNGNITFKGNTNIVLTDKNAIAFDICKYSSYPSVNVTFEENFTGEISGKIMYDSSNAETHKLTINGNGTFGSIGIASGSASNPAIAIKGGTFSDLSCLDYLESGADVTVKLADDVALDTRYSIKAKVTLDLAGHAITIGDTVEAKSGLFVVDNNGDLTIEDSSAAKAGTIDVTTDRKYTGTDYPAIWAAVIVYPDSGYPAKLTVNGGTLKAPYYPISGSGNCTDADCTTITINGGKLESTDGLAIYHPQNGKLVINDGELLGQETAIEMRAGTLTVNGGVFTATNTPTQTQPNGSGTTTDGAAIAVCQHSTKLRTEVTINGGTFNGFSALYEHNAQNNSAEDLQKVVLSVTGGTFNTINGGAVAVYSADKTGFITGGTFSSDPSDYVESNGTNNIVKRSGSEGSYTYTVIAKKNLTDGVYMSDPTGSVASGYVVSQSGETYTVSVYIPPYIPPTTTTEVTENEDGSTTTTVTDKTTGTVTETTTTEPVTDEEGNTTQTTTETVTNKDGSTTETVTETVETADGSTTETVTETVTDADGATVTTETVTATDPTGTTATTTTTTDAAGESNTQVAIVVSEQAAADSAESGAPVTLPVTATTEETAPAVSIEIPAAVSAENKVKVEIPVENMTAGTVAVIVNEDGTEEVIVDSKMGENGVVVELDGNATLKIVDNSKEFEDLENSQSWVTEAVAYTSARELFNGTSDTTFSPEKDTTRGMVVAVLHRMASEPETDAENIFNDVSDKAYYADAVKWAAENEIVKGYGDSFGATDTITREQLAVMLYNYAQYIGADTSARADLEADFTDGGSTHSWAKEALSWANAMGLLKGFGNGEIAPTGSATRAQVAAVIYRFCETVAK